MPPPVRKPPINAQIEAVKPWDDPSLRPQPSPTPPGLPIAAEVAPQQPADEVTTLAQDLEKVREKFKNMIPEWLWNTPPAAKPPTKP